MKAVVYQLSKGCGITLKKDKTNKICTSIDGLYTLQLASNA
jgi:hypothetical protein